ncbi:hypothetical protein J3458_020623 [Metarhizium acridum]|uniref:uncharacterized protein n=1 Tax=Metarhizium acridum TaxID=92637 RepID=UPI001C6A91F0|nr:hypothetical protein J3458_020623 [Metarhizium acridum]
MTSLTNGTQRHPGSDGSPNGTSPTSKCIPINDQPAFTPKRLRVVCSGAGYSGLMFAYKYKYETPSDGFIDLIIYEKNDDVGGTWLENRYPGVACDVPAHIYTFFFGPNPDWTSFYASGPEIWQYIKKTTDKYNLDEKVQFNSTVASTVWDDDKGKWLLKIQRGDQTIEDQADINGSGLLNRWKWPAIEDLHSFKGKLLHSASWDTSFDWTGKRVGIIGNGSSGIQTLPQMQPGAGQIVHYIRSPTWISNPFSADLTPEGKNFNYSKEERARFRENPEGILHLRKTIAHHFNQSFYANIIGNPQGRAASKDFEDMMKRRLNNDPKLCEKLIPKFSAISKVTVTTIQTRGGFEELDAIVCATGFDVGFVPHWEVIGKNGVNLAEQWKDEPTAYGSVCSPNMPNYFIFNGPNAAVGHGSLLSVMEWTAEYILRWCRKIATNNIKSATVDPIATEEYNEYTQAWLKRTVWTSGCRSWFENNRQEGNVTAMYAGIILHYKEFLESFRTEDFNIDYHGPNRFAFLGNGLTAREQAGGDLALYVYK